MYKYLLYLGFALCLDSSLAIAAENTDTLEDRYISMALQGDLRGAAALFNNLGTDPQPASVQDLAHRFESRFLIQNDDLSPATGDDLADAIVSTYRMYWIETLTGRLTPQEGLLFLKSSLHPLLNPPTQEDHTGALAESWTVTGPDVSDVFARMGMALENRGFYYLETKAPPLQDLFLWKREENKNYTVRLTDRNRPVRVTFMSEIYSMGWKQFATLGLVATTGWVEGDRLYCVNGAYDRLSEEFRVSYLKHEGQHLSDYERFPGLSSEDLEYRAKLTELAFASLTLAVILNDFTARGAANAVSPHAMANYRVTQDLYQELYDEPFSASGEPWKGVSPSAVSAAARRLLQNDTQRLNSTRLQD